MIDDRDTENDPIAELKASPLWSAAQQYADRRVKGVAAERDQLRQQLEAARAEGGEAVSKLADAEKLSATVQASISAMVDRLPADKRELIPEFGSASDKLQWLTRNYATLAAPAQRDPQVADGPGRAGIVDQQKAELAALDRAIAAKNRGRR